MSFLNAIYHNHLLSNQQIGQIHPVYKAAVSIHGAQYSLPIRCWFSRLKVARCRLPRTLVCRDALVLASTMRGCARRSSGSTVTKRDVAPGCASCVDVDGTFLVRWLAFSCTMPTFVRCSSRGRLDEGSRNVVAENDEGDETTVMKKSVTLWLHPNHDVPSQRSYIQPLCIGQNTKLTKRVAATNIQK